MEASTSTRSFPNQSRSELSHPPPIFNSNSNEALTLPSLPRFEDYANAIASKYILGHKDSKNYKMLVKALTKKACEPLSAADSKEVESYVGVVRVEKTKAEQAAKAKLVPAKKSLQGSGKGGLSVGLDDYQYADAGDGDDDFM